MVRAGLHPSLQNPGPVTGWGLNYRAIRTTLINLAAVNAL
jgi:hypothetical protein